MSAIAFNCHAQAHGNSDDTGELDTFRFIRRATLDLGNKSSIKLRVRVEALMPKSVDSHAANPKRPSFVGIRPATCTYVNGKLFYSFLPEQISPSGTFACIAALGQLQQSSQS